MVDNFNRKQQELAKRFAQLKATLDEAKAASEKASVVARKVAGPYGALLDAETLVPIRAATEREMNASIAAARGDDPVGPVTVRGRKCFAVPPWLLDEAPVSAGSKRASAGSKRAAKVHGMQRQDAERTARNFIAKHYPEYAHWNFEDKGTFDKRKSWSFGLTPDEEDADYNPERSVPSLSAGRTRCRPADTTIAPSPPRHQLAPPDPRSGPCLIEPRDPQRGVEGRRGKPRRSE